MTMLKTLILLLVLFGSSCWDSPYLTKNMYKDMPKKEWRHMNGLVLRVAEILPVKQTEDGFEVYSENLGTVVFIRSREVKALNSFEKSESSEQTEKIQRIGDRKISYEEKIEELGGNGGRAYHKFSAREYFDSTPNYDKEIYVSYHQSSLSGSLGFELAWHVVEGTSYEK